IDPRHGHFFSGASRMRKTEVGRQSVRTYLHAYVRVLVGPDPEMEYTVLEGPLEKAVFEGNDHVLAPFQPLVQFDAEFGTRQAGHRRTEDIGPRFSLLKWPKRKNPVLFLDLRQVVQVVEGKTMRAFQM